MVKEGGTGEMAEMKLLTYVQLVILYLSFYIP